MKIVPCVSKLPSKLVFSPIWMSSLLALRIFVAGPSPSWVWSLVGLAQDGTLH
jgi:hypothetical protein